MGYKCSRGRGLNISQFLDNAKTDRTPTRGWGGVSMNRSREGEVRELVETRSRRFLLMRGKREGRRLTSKREGNRLVDTSHRSQIFGLVSK